MCGIVGVAAARPLAMDEVARARHARDRMHHRGPDAAGEWCDAAGGIYFGHRRLKIVDLSDAAAQPMTAGEHVLTYNGEIYNFRELRRELEGKGVRFQSESDTEVLLQAWRQWGPSALDRLDGMFAFALWDGSSLFMATDPFGEKPLYVAEHGDAIWFSSELPPLVQALSLEPDLSGDRFLSFMALGFVSDPQTAYPQIRRLAPATLVEVRNGRLTSVRRYWSPPAYEVRNDKLEPLSETQLDDVLDVLLESLRRRVIADVPLCLLLSNGVDSTLIAALIARELHLDPTCLTVNFTGDDRNESDAAAKVAQTLGLNHIVVPGVDDPAHVTPDLLLDRFGQPNDNAAMSTLEQVAGGAREAGFVVGLTGFGGDEAFFGYLKHQLLWRRRGLYRMPEGLRLLLGAALSPIAGIEQRARIFRNLLAVPDSQRYLALKNQPAIHTLRRLGGFDDWARRTFVPGADLELEVPAFDRDCVMPASQLTASDLGAMRRSVELRTPFLSRRLFDLLGRYDPRVFVAFGQKAFTRSLLSRYLPREAVLKSKRGFLFPMQRLIEGRRSDPPIVPGVPKSLVDDAFSRRDAGHMRLALRLLLAERFPDWHSTLLQQSRLSTDRAAAACAF